MYNLFLANSKTKGVTSKSEEIFWLPPNCAEELHVIVLQYTCTRREEVSLKSNSVKNHECFAKIIARKITETVVNHYTTNFLHILVKSWHIESIMLKIEA